MDFSYGRGRAREFYTARIEELECGGVWFGEERRGGYARGGGRTRCRCLVVNQNQKQKKHVRPKPGQQVTMWFLHIEAALDKFKKKAALDEGK